MSGIFPITLSDHYLVWHISHLLLPQTGPAYFLKRQITEVNKNKFTELVSNTDWTSVLNSEDTQLAFTDFHSTFRSHFENSFPIIRVNYKYNNRKPWLTQSLRDSIKHKNKLYTKSMNIPTLANELAYKSEKKYVSKALLAAEKEHIQHLLNLNKNNLSKSWRIIKEL